MELLASIDQAGRLAPAPRLVGHDCVFAATEMSALSRICEPAVALTVWRRKLDAAVLTELDRLDLDAVDDIRLVAPLEQLEPVLAGALYEAGYEDVPHLYNDMVALAREHASIARTGGVRIRLEVVETDACRKFHADYVTVRTLSTYRGQGTQWIDALLLSQGGDGSAGIEQLQTGWVGTFKGRDWKPNPSILHRSPPLRSSSEQRLLLVIDPAIDHDHHVLARPRETP